MGHPTGSPKLHMAMTAKRRNKLRKLAEEIPVPEVYGDQEGDTLLVGWGSTYGPIHDAVALAREHGEKVGALHLRHLHPLPNGLEKVFEKFKRIVTVEMNDQGVYGYRSARHDFAGPVLRTENHELYQDRRTHVPGERNSATACSMVARSRRDTFRATARRLFTKTPAGKT